MAACIHIDRLTSIGHHKNMTCILQYGAEPYHVSIWGGGILVEVRGKYIVFLSIRQASAKSG